MSIKDTKTTYICDMCETVCDVTGAFHEYPVTLVPYGWTATHVSPGTSGLRHFCSDECKEHYEQVMEQES